MVCSKAAAYHSDKRRQIVDTLKDVPKTVRSIQDYRQLFPTDLKLDDIAVELYLILLAIIEGIVKWLVDKATCMIASSNSIPRLIRYKGDILKIQFKVGSPMAC